MHRYELTDMEWERIKKYFPNKEPGHLADRQSPPIRPVINGIAWVARSGAPWRDLPKLYGSWETVYTHFRQLIDNGTAFS